MVFYLETMTKKSLVEQYLVFKKLSFKQAIKKLISKSSQEIFSAFNHFKIISEILSN